MSPGEARLIQFFEADNGKLIERGGAPRMKAQLIIVDMLASNFLMVAHIFGVGFNRGPLYGRNRRSIDSIG